LRVSKTCSAARDTEATSTKAAEHVTPPTTDLADAWLAFDSGAYHRETARAQTGWRSQGASAGQTAPAEYRDEVADDQWWRGATRRGRVACDSAGVTKTYKALFHSRPTLGENPFAG